jgi:hypothetical protein
MMYDTRIIIGSKVRYKPVTIDSDKPIEGTVTHIQQQGTIFNQTMIVIDTVEHWIPASECEVL